jgi:hypothetical protein
MVYNMSTQDINNEFAIKLIQIEAAIIQHRKGLIDDLHTLDWIEEIICLEGDEVDLPGNLSIEEVQVQFEQYFNV